MLDSETVVGRAEPLGIPDPRILVVDDDEVDRIKMERLLTEIFGSTVQLGFAATWDSAVEAVEAKEHDIYILDYRLGARTGLEIIEGSAREDDPRVFILLTGQENKDVDMAATRAGVADYLIKKDLTAIRLERCLRYATESIRQKRQLIEQAGLLTQAKAAIEKEARKHLTVSQDLLQTQRELTTALIRAENSERRYRWLAQHDLLTGITNRSLFSEELRKNLELASRSQKRLALLLMDLDRFKWINDGFGHQVGDKLLMEVAERLAKALRKSDTIARLGGDEFAIIATNLDHESSASVAAEKIVEALEKPFDIAGHHIQSGASVGIAVSTAEGHDDPEEMMHKADAALYRAKNSGRGVFAFFDEDLNQQVQRSLLLKRELPIAIAEGQFNLVFQPKIDLALGTLCGLEALARWNHPRIGPIPPDEFIAVAEATGQVVPLSVALFEEALKIASRWRGTSLEGKTIGLNLSPIQLKQMNLVSWIAALLDRYGLDPSVLELEITETAALENQALAAEQLKKLRECGIGISIDDFGTGYSSLALATTLPADCLKIDISFVSGMLTNRADAAAVGTTITLAQSLGMRTVAEGVETQEQLAYLRARACDEAQGYLFTKPISAEELLIWHDDHIGRILPAA